MRSLAIKEDLGDLVEDVEVSSLQVRATRGIIYTIISQIMRIIVGTVGQITLARMLLPHDYGIVAMATPALAFINIFNTFGLSSAIIQRKEITYQDLNALYWMGLGVSTLCALIVIALSPAIGFFYHQPSAGYVCAAIAILMPLGALSGHAGALMARRMQFGAIAAMEVIAAILSLVVGIVCARSGLHYWSLVIGPGAGSVFITAAEWRLSGWRPSRPGWSATARPLLNFGANLTGFNLLSTFSLYADNVFVGYFRGPAALGLFDKAFTLVLSPLGSVTAPIGRVAIPLLARIVDDKASYRRAYLAMLQAMLLLATPGLLVGSLMAHTVVVTLLGRSWEGTSPILSYICVAAMFTPFSGSSVWLFNSQGRLRDQLKSGVVSSGLILLAMLAGLHWGPVGIALAYAVFAPAVHGSFSWIAAREGPIRMQDILASTGPVALGLAAAIPAVYGLGLIPHVPGLVRVGAAIPVAYVVTSGVALLFPGVRRSAALLRNLRR